MEAPHPRSGVPIGIGTAYMSPWKVRAGPANGVTEVSVCVYPSGPEGGLLTCCVGNCRMCCLRSSLPAGRERVRIPGAWNRWSTGLRLDRSRMDGKIPYGPLGAVPRARRRTVPTARDQQERRHPPEARIYDHDSRQPFRPTLAG
jgi:hypothetical protein